MNIITGAIDALEAEERRRWETGMLRAAIGRAAPERTCSLVGTARDEASHDVVAWAVIDGVTVTHKLTAADVDGVAAMTNDEWCDAIARRLLAQLEPAPLRLDWEERP